jgi:peptide-methionine (R)-S-oxide reductase
MKFVQSFLAVLCALACAKSSPQQEPAASSKKADYSLASYPRAADKIERPDSAWRASLTTEQYEVLRNHGTERAFTGKYWNNHAEGIYTCAACGSALFDAATKFESGTGWPSFTAPIQTERVSEIVDDTYGMTRTEVRCARCGSHLGHVFNDGPKPTGLRYCMNSAALGFDAK